MKRLSALLSICAVLAILAVAGAAIIEVPEAVGRTMIISAGVTTACTGYSTDCTYTTAVDNEIQVTEDRAEANRWVANVSGTVTRVKYYCGTHTDGTEVRIGVWNGTQLRGQSDDIRSVCDGAGPSWQWFTVNAYSGRSLAFASSDVIRYGVQVDYAGNGVNVRYEAGANVAGYDRYNGAYPQDPATWSELGANEPGWGMILEYTY